MAEDQANILLVDDQPANLLALEAVLEELGHRLVRAGSGEEALRRLLDQDFAVILLDVRMHGLDGFETAKLIRGRERSRNPPSSSSPLTRTTACPWRRRTPSGPWTTSSSQSCR